MRHGLAPPTIAENEIVTVFPTSFSAYEYAAITSNATFVSGASANEM